MPYGRRTTYTNRKRRPYTANRNIARKKANRFTKKSGYTRYKTIGQTRALRAKWVNPISTKALVRFTYADSGFSRTLTAIGGYYAYYVFRGNSLFDPDYTGVGVQPYGYDNLCTSNMYSNYRVTASAIRAYFRPESTYADVRRLHAFILPYNDSAPVLSDISDTRMMPQSRETVYDGATESTKGAKLKHYMSTQKINPVYTSADAGNQAAYSANPTNVWFWLIIFYLEEYDDEEVDIYFDVKIKYYSILQRSFVPNES